VQQYSTQAQKWATTNADALDKWGNDWSQTHHTEFEAGGMSDQGSGDYDEETAGTLKEMVGLLRQLVANGSPAINITLQGELATLINKVAAHLVKHEGFYNSLAEGMAQDEGYALLQGR
jgi:hypothetical protein